MSARGVITSSTRSIWKAWAWSTRRPPVASARASAAVCTGSGTLPRSRRIRARRPRLGRAGGLGSSLLAIVSPFGRIGVGDPQSGQDNALQPLHLQGVGVGFVIVAY